MISMRDTCPEDIQKTLMKYATDVQRQKANNHETENLWFEAVKALLKRKVYHSWTARHAAQAKSWIVSGAWTQQRLFDICQK